MDVINQQADFGREADFKLGNKEEREAKARACSSFLRAACLVVPMSGAQPQPCSEVLGAVEGEDPAHAQAQAVRCRGPTLASPS